MPDITRTQSIVVDKVETNTYGDLTFTDKEGVSRSIGKARRIHFEKTIVPGAGVILNYTSNPHKPNTEYIYSAELVKDKLPAAVNPPEIKLEPQHLEKEKIVASISGTAPPLKEPAPQAVGMTTKEIGDMIRAKMLTEVFGKETAIKLLNWYKGQILSTTKVSESHLVEEAKKLGATEIKE